MRVRQPFKSNGKLDVARPDDVLDLELGELCVEPELLNDTRVPAHTRESRDKDRSVVSSGFYFIVEPSTSKRWDAVIEKDLRRRRGQNALSRSQPRVVLALRTRDYHLSARKDQRRRLWISNSHDDRCESLLFSIPARPD